MVITYRDEYKMPANKCRKGLLRGYKWKTNQKQGYNKCLLMILLDKNKTDA